MRFSIVMPVYNPPVEHFQRALASVTGQTYADWELIVVDDGSTDPAVDRVLANLQDEDPRVSVFRKANGGPSAARNQGTSVARGNYVMYLDADDELSPGVFAEAALVLQDHPVDLLLAYVQYIKKDSEKVYFSSTAPTRLSDDDIDQLYAATLAGSHSGFSHPLGAAPTKIAVKNGPVARFIERELAQRTPFPDAVPVSEDTLWNLRLLNDVSTVAVLPSIWYWYRVAHKSTSRGFRPTAYADTRTFIQELESVLASAARPCNDGDAASRVLGEINRAVKTFYSLPECKLTWREKSAQLATLLRGAESSSLLTAKSVRAAGAKALIKYALIRSGLILPYTTLTGARSAVSQPSAADQES